MGTRADFYVGRGESAEWLGSIAWDGYPSGVAGKKFGGSAGDVAHCPLFTATTEAAFRSAVAEELASRQDGTIPEQGWPWPWDDSGTTDYSYAFDDGVVYATNWGYRWWKAADALPEYERKPPTKEAVFPDMKSRQNVTLGKRSGVIVVGSNGPISDGA